MTTGEVLALIERERRRQEEKWGTQRHGLTVWLTVLMEEIGEVSAGVLTLRSLATHETTARQAQLADLVMEVVQIATVAVAMAEHLGEALAAGEGLPAETWA